jgi:hypothetical protein
LQQNTILEEHAFDQSCNRKSQHKKTRHFAFEVDLSSRFRQAILLVKHRAWIPAIIALIAVGCGNKKERHLEKFLDPTKVQVEAPLEAINISALPNDPAIQQHVNSMSFPEAARRLGAHRFSCEIKFTMKRDDSEVALTESDKIELAKNGDFRAMVENNAGLGYEVIFSNGHYYIRNRYSVFHEDDIIDNEHLRLRDSAFGGWAAIYRLYRGQLSFLKPATVNHHGRKMLRLSIGLSSSKPSLPGTMPQPLVPVGVSKYIYPIKPTLAEKHAWRDHTTPTEARGTILVDAESGVVVGVDFDGSLTFSVPSGPSGAVTISTRVNSDNFGNLLSIAAPSADQVKPMPKRMEVDTHPLDFYFGKGFTATLGPAAGVAAKPDKPSPDNESQKDSESGGSESSP